ncbi:uncharacterized protein LOC118201855 [Stegodyphus dumicola]|uniref:uncharacterized protein LOC118201855 n=1 Tax=Stegodyphus dumicola TaxID=202533 RepID=UPI0015AA200B|nr:uncharacterized protein LOC118201855 [Stegodyphus dumicola]
MNTFIFILSAMCFAVAATTATFSDFDKSFDRNSTVDAQNSTEFQSYPEVVRPNSTVRSSKMLPSVQRNASEIEAVRAAAKKDFETGQDAKYIPPITEVECHVEYQITQRAPGRCINLLGMGTVRACQAGVYLAFQSSECN